MRYPLMNCRSLPTVSLLLCLVLFGSCQKWVDHPAKNLGLTSKYCNNPAAINYNQGYPGIEDSTVCIFPSEPFVGNYRFRDSIYDDANILSIGDSILFSITKESRTRISCHDFCASGNQLFFTADRYYKANGDSLLFAGAQTMCRTQDTLMGSLLYRPADSSLYIEFKVMSDTGIRTHKGFAFKR